MGFFNKLFKSTSEGLIEAYLETYRNIKNTPLYQVAAEGFSEEFQAPKEFHYVNTAIAARRYEHYQIEIVTGDFMVEVGEYIDRNNYLSERQMLICLLRSAHLVEAGRFNPRFESIANEYITKYFGQHELSDRLDIQNLKKFLQELS
ncbi:MAG: hypothetical protein HQ551_12030 [Desulfobacteraceae bacterium]|nr:hypothetical protein [Desulfobacteraceae bacterium]